MTEYNQERFDQLVAQVLSGRILPSQFMAEAAQMGVPLSVVMSVLDVLVAGDGQASEPHLAPRPTRASIARSAPRLPAGWNPYPWEWGKEPIASTTDAATEWWLARTADMSVRDDDPAVVLTSDEIALLRRQRPRVGHGWYSLQVPAIQGWKRFWQKEVHQWAHPMDVNFDVQARHELQLLGAQFLIDQRLTVAGNVSFDWVLFNDAMKEYHRANVATTSLIAPASIYYPTTSTCMQDAETDFTEMVRPLAERLRDEGYAEVDAVWLVEKAPSWWSVSRRIGFQRGLDDPANQAICRINVVEIISVTENESAQTATEDALRRHSNVHLFIMLGHQYAGAASAIRSADRRDVWVAACDLDDGSARDLLSGGWPTCITYSLPIAQLAWAEANVMGKLLLGKRVPLIVLSKGTVATPQNVEQAYAHDWGGEALPGGWKPSDASGWSAAIIRTWPSTK